MRTFSVDIEYVTKKDVKHSAILEIEAISIHDAEKQAKALIRENGQRQCKTITSVIATPKKGFMFNKPVPSREPVGIFGRLKNRLFSHA
jgi:hypothetical protein